MARAAALVGRYTRIEVPSVRAFVHLNTGIRQDASCMVRNARLPAVTAKALGLKAFAASIQVIY